MAPFDPITSAVSSPNPPGPARATRWWLGPGGQGNPSDSNRAPLCGPNMVPLPEMKSLLRTLMAFGKLAKA